MSYLQALMSNDVPSEGNAKSVFKKCNDEDRIVVPSAVQQTEESPVEDKKVRKVFKKDFKNKNSLRKGGFKNKKTSKKNSKPSDPDYKEAFEQAQKQFLKECRPDSNGNAIISQSIEYIHNWQGYYVKVDLSDDDIQLKHNEKDYTFSRKRFISNKYFQNMIRDEYNNAYGNAYLRFFPTKGEENMYTIHVKAGRR
tara:strand:+ start:303 stop:890 length:588 start_codon:yes stop_codon:yes gene_type:complete